MNMRIALLCNDRLAMPALAALIEAGLVVAVAMPAKRSDTRSWVQKFCAEKKVPFCVFNKQEFGLQLINWLHQHQPEVVFVKTFPWKVPAAALSLPRHGFINFHYAPLPEWRGANPLFWMVRNKATAGAVTVHKMDTGYDTGPILLVLPVPLIPDMTLGMFVTQLAYKGIDAAALLLKKLADGTMTAMPQTESLAQWYRHPVEADLVIDWQHMPAADIKALVKACNPWNKGAATSWNQWTFGITEVTILDKIPAAQSVRAGAILDIDPANGFRVACCDGVAIRIDIAYCEEGYFPGHHLQLFGIKKYDQLGKAPATPVVKTAATTQEALVS